MATHVIGVAGSAMRLDTRTFEPREPADPAVPLREHG